MLRTGSAVILVALALLGWRDPGGPTSAQAQTVPATAYLDIDYSGTNASFTRDVDDLRRVAGPCGGNWNDCLSSLAIPSGWSITVYQDINYGGAFAVFVDNVPDLRTVSGPCANAWNDCVSSIRIRALRASGSIPMSGDPVRAFAALDRATAALMEQHHVPGVAIGITRNGRLVFARGYGYADRESGTPVSPDSRFRLASVSKAFTAAAIDRLVEQAALSYEAKVFDVLRVSAGLSYPTQDQRIAEGTIKQFLEHKSGWSDDRGGNRYGDVGAAANALGLSLPIAFANLIRYEFGKRLDLAPGSQMQYCNFCYGVLGQVVETRGGTSYERFVRDRVLSGIGAHRTALAEESRAARLTGEVTYYTPSGTPYVASGLQRGPAAAAGGWVSTTADVLRLAASVTLGSAPALFSVPPRSGWAFSGLPIGRGFVWRHDGSLPGTATTLTIRDDLAWCVLTNGQLQSAGGSFVDDIDRILTTTVQTVTAWPATDLFPRYLASAN